MHHRYLFKAAVFMVCIISSFCARALQPEDILGEYWKDPLFGVAAAEQNIQFEVLHKLLFSPNNKVHAGKKTRIVFENKTSEVHVFVFTHDGVDIADQASLSRFVDDELHHANMAGKPSVGHHDHASSASDGAKAIVRTMAENPTVTISPEEFKEIIIRFENPGTVKVLCMVAGHEELEHESLLVVKESVFDAMELEAE
jgi:uncharacterized cupredoxin-like copper-binding protein